jgi:hypothetical protein
VISADDGPGGMFRHFPFFQRLLSWTKPYGHRYRARPLLRVVRLEQPAGDEPENRAIMPS